MAGYVDAVGFLAAGGYFVSFMSGNSTRLAVGLASSAPHVIAMSGVPICSFLAGVVVSTLVARKAGRFRAPAVLGLVAAGLAAAATAGGLGFGLAAIGLAAAAMGAENALLERDGEVAVGLTYMTGALVKLGQGLAAHLAGASRFAWAPYLALWAGLVAGATGGALAFPRLGIGALWAAALTVGAASLYVLRWPPHYASR